MKKTRKLISLILVGAVAITSLFCGAATASARGGAGSAPPYYVEFTENMQSDMYNNNKDTPSIVVKGISYLEIYDYFDQIGIIDALEQVKYNGVYEKIDKEVSNNIVMDLGFTYKNESYGLFYSYPSETFYAYKGIRTNPKKIDDVIGYATIAGSNDSSYSSSYGFIIMFNESGKNTAGFIDAIKNSKECLMELGVEKMYNTNEKKILNFNGFTRPMSVPFKVLKPKPVIAENNSKDISSLDISTIPSCKYTGKAINPSVTIRDGDYTLIRGTDYSLSCTDKNIGTAKVTVTGKGVYSGTKELTFDIIPGNTTLSVKNSGGKYTLKWKKVKGISKYEIQYSDDGGKTYSKSVTVSSGKKSKTLKLDKSKTYVFRIRTFKKAGKKKYYSDWSDDVTVK